MESKQLSHVAIKSADLGQVTAVFSTFVDDLGRPVVDRDGDVTSPQAIKNGAEVVISAYEHGSWEGRLPVGKGVVRVSSREAVLEGQFFLDTNAGRDTFNVVKNLGRLQEWSYSLHDVVAEWTEIDGRPVRVLKSIVIKEVSPVLRGAGIDTRTLDTKAAREVEADAHQEYLRFVRLGLEVTS